ncbi:LysR family transcriptional regulator [Thioclava sp. SK-1]|uniref:LysR family transcriptional regulator n=1 Tax=Thioclava sp. SK-1 TaxID=1889770 RepID=UPI0008244A4C|nr:LysR family transcriptional regulator [Thioclava sp. SK-1]OCX65973.1 LysR family transcriptional regulator [Thioclava sp. SK-1]
MIAPRRFLPSVNSLLALEAVDRLGTATAAAQELSLTHSAVSRQLKVLEDQIGVQMLVREGKGLRLTPAGAIYAASVRDYLQDLARASLKLRASGSRNMLNLAIHPSFGMHWLGPRLKGFMARHPDVIVHQSTRIEPFDFEREKFDAAIHYGLQDWAGVNYLHLSGDRVIPVCAPGFLKRPEMVPNALMAKPLLHLESRPGAWESWFEGHGIAADRRRGMLFDQFASLTEAAVLGFGVALLPEFIAEPEFGRGRLIPAYSGYTAVEGAYFLVWPEGAERNRALCQLLDWLRGSL